MYFSKNYNLFKKFNIPVAKHPEYFVLYLYDNMPNSNQLIKRFFYLKQPNRNF